MPFFVNQHYLDCQAVTIAQQKYRISELENELAILRGQFDTQANTISNLQIQTSKDALKKETFKEFTSELEKVVDTFSQNIQDILAKFPECDSQSEQS